MIGGRSAAFALRVSMASSLLIGCTAREMEDSESTVSWQEALLNGTFTSSGNLTKTSEKPVPPFPGCPSPCIQPLSANEVDRRADTESYYANSPTAPNVPTLGDFKARFFSAGETASAVYYNRGDLGIGREMHCSDKTFNPVTGVRRYACYVTNFAAGADNTEFTFGYSPGIAFKNTHDGHSFATVAMVAEQLQFGGFRVEYLVYGASDNSAQLNASELQPTAALDRVGVAFAEEFKSDTTPDPAKFGTPGTNFNNHIPTNCLSCHGGKGQYANDGTTFGTGAYGSTFLPFDLTQFDFDSTPGRTRADQEANFRKLNEFVRTVANITGNPGPGGVSVGSAIVQQIDRWYANTSGSATLSGNFQDHRVPVGWDDGNDSVESSDEALYRKVVGPYCRNCHMSQDYKTSPADAENPFAFKSAANFRSKAGVSVLQICSSQMPHSLQTLRGFWQSGAPAALKDWLENNSDPTIVGLTSTFMSDQCRPGTAVTLDAPVLYAALSGL